MTTIAIELHGTIRHGLWSVERGESRWAQNLAAVLGAAGHDVIGFGPMAGNGWGVCPKMPGVRLVDWSEESRIEADYYIDTAHWVGKPVKVKARHVLRGYFGGGEVNADDWAPNHHLVVPYAHLFTNWHDPATNKQANNMELLPYAMPNSEWWRQFAPSAFLDVLPHKRTRILWGTKDTLGAGSNCSPAHVAWADSALGLAAGLKLDGWNPTFLGRQSFEPSYSDAAKALDVLKRAEAIGQVFAYLPLGQVLQLMRESMVALMPAPGLGSFPLECVAEGCVPVVWDTNQALSVVAREMGLLMETAPFSPARLRENVDLLLHDRDLRELALQRYGAELVWYKPAVVQTCWDKLTQRWP